MNKHLKLGCDLCQEICNSNNINISLNGFYENTYVYLKMCRNCDKPACIEACSGDGIHWNEELRQVIFETDNCVRCNMCIMLCPFDAIRTKNEYNYNCQSCDQYTTLLNKMKLLSEEKDKPTLNELTRESFAEDFINKTLK